MSGSESGKLTKRKFGKTDLMVPPIAIGCAPLGDMPDTFAYSVSEADGVATVLAALDSEINFIDVAALYGDGEAERRVGLALKERGGLPKGAVLQTKQGRDPKTGIYDGDTVKWRMERSLKLLGVDRIDIVYLHDAEWTTFDAIMAPGGPVDVLRDYHEQGVITHLGVASGPVDVELRYINTGIFDAVITHNRYTLLNQSANPILDAASQKGLAVLNAAPYGSGMLAKGPEAYPRYAYQQASTPMVERTRQLVDICQRYDVPLAAVALQFSTNDPRITTTIVGMSKPERIQQTIDLATIAIPEALWGEIHALPPFEDDPEKNRFK